MFHIFTIICIFKATTFAQMSTKEIQFLNELPIDKLIKLKSSLQDFVTESYQNVSVTTPSYLQAFGAQAMAMKAPVKRTDYEEALNKKEESKISHIFSMSVTTLAFLAFGGYLLCLIVHAVKAKDSYGATTVSPTTFFVSAGIKKRPQPQFSSYGGRKKRDNREQMSLEQLNITPEQLFNALMQLCEGYAKWSER